MFWRPRRLGVLTVALTIAAIAGCGGQSSLAALKDPGVRGVEALRQDLRTALRDHDKRVQCELFAPILLGSRGGSVETCARSLEPSNMPYMKNASAYVAGGHIELRGNEAIYTIPFGQVPSEDPTEFTSEDPQVAFAAAYTEGIWRVVSKPE
jgi:hypothetical protein